MMTSKPILLDLPMPIMTERLLIRPMMPGNGRVVNEAVNESLHCLKEWLPWAQRPLTVEESEETARRFYAEFILREALHLIILDASTGRFIGGTGFNRIKWSVPRGDIGYWCRTSEQGKGYIREAVQAVVFYAFEVMKLRRVSIHADAENSTSRKVAESLGFSKELEAKGFMEKPGTDDLRVGCLYSRLDTVGLQREKIQW